MSQTLDSTAEAVDQARQRLLWALSHVPDDRLTWSPAPSAKSALGIISHLVSSNAFFVSALTTGAVDAPPDGPGPEFTDRQAAIDAFSAGIDALIAAIRGLSEDQLTAVIATPFGQSSAAFFLRIAPLHTFGHASQLEYLQSCWGDTDFHWTD
jgi:uncharacterized damage-inducible protein DinB